MPTLAEKTTGTAAAKNGANGHTKITLSRDELIEALMRTDGKAEIINGRIRRFMATGSEPGNAGGNIYVALKLWMRETQAPGRAYPDNVGFLCDLTNRQSFSPDAAYYIGEMTPAKFLPKPPVFAVEVRSEGDYGAVMEGEMEAKRADYFATETEVVWDVDVLRGEIIVRKFTKAGGAIAPVAVFKRGEVADAEPAVPDFSMKVDDLFE